MKCIILHETHELIYSNIVSKKNLPKFHKLFIFHIIRNIYISNLDYKLLPPVERKNSCIIFSAHSEASAKIKLTSILKILLEASKIY